MQATQPGNRVKRTGIPPGWFVLDAEWTTIVNHGERRAVELQLPDAPETVDSQVFCCYQRWVNELVFHFIGWVATYEDAEAWLRNEIPGTMAVSSIPAPIPGLTNGSPQYGQPQAERE